MDNRLYRACLLLTQLMVVQLLTVITGALVVTVPVALLAAFTVFRMLGEPDEPTIAELCRRYFRTFVEDIPTNLTLTLGWLVAGANLWVLLSAVQWRPTRPAFWVPAVFLCDWLLTATAVGARFRLRPLALLRTGFFLALANLYRGVPALALGAILLVVADRSTLAILALGCVGPLYLFDRLHRRPLTGLADLVTN